MIRYVSYDTDKREIRIQGLALTRLKNRMNDTYRSTSGFTQVKGTNIMKMFNTMRYIQWDLTEIKFFSFFAIEVYEMFSHLAEEYQDESYAKVAEELYSETWIGNFEKKEKIQTPIRNLLEFNLQPKDFQLEFIKKYSGLKYAHDLDGYVLSFEQGLGKTFTAIALAECLGKEHVYIICPNPLKEVWANEILKYYKKYNNNQELWRDEVFVSDVKSLSRITKNTKFFITNQESINNISQFVDPMKRNMIIVDESHNFRGLATKRVEQLLNLKEKANCHDCLMMSGTPIKAIPNEIVPTLRMIDPHFTPEMASIYYDTFTDKSTIAAAVVKERFRRVIYRKLKKGTLKLPEKQILEMKLKIPKPEKYAVSRLQKEILEEFHKEYLSRLESGLFTNNKKSIFYRKNAEGYNFERERIEFERLVRKYSSAHPSRTEQYLNFIFQRTEDTTWELINAMNVEYKYFDFINRFVVPFCKSNDEKYKLTKDINGIFGWAIAAKGATGTVIGKLIAEYKNECFIEIWKYNCEEIIEKILSNEKKTVIFTAQVPTANYISDDLNKKGIKNIKIIGDSSGKMNLISQFKNDEDTRVLIATTQTLANGVTLTEASQMFFFGTPYRSTDFNQAADRIHRIGQDSPVIIYNILLHSQEKNITNRIDEILNWSSEMFDSLINESTDINILEALISFFGTDNEKIILENIKKENR